MADSSSNETKRDDYPIEEIRSEHWEAIKHEIVQLEYIIFSPHNLHEDEEGLRKIFTSGLYICLVARDRRGEIVAYLAAGPIEEFKDMIHIEDDPEFGMKTTLYLTSIAVHPKCQGKGIGKKLLWTLMSKAKEKGYKRITGHFLDLSEVIFKRAGGRVLKEYKDWYYPGLDATYMELDLKNIQV